MGDEQVESDVEVAGLPCVDQSKCGKQLKEQGPTAMVFLSHAKLHIEKQTPLILLENVQGWVSFFQFLLLFGLTINGFFDMMNYVF